MAYREKGKVEVDGDTLVLLMLPAGLNVFRLRPRESERDVDSERHRVYRVA